MKAPSSLAALFLSVLSIFLDGASAASQDYNRVSAAWFASWNQDNGFSVSDIPWDKFTHVTYSFAETNANGTVTQEELMHNFVFSAHNHSTKALVSAGGWTGSRFFSSNVATADNRTAFVNTISNLATQYNFDGIDFDWEYPGNQGIGCNVVSPDDVGNFLQFLQQLRKDPVGSRLFLTAATSLFPWLGPDGSPSTDLSGFAEVLDYIAIMNYDIYGPWASTAGPNAPLNDTCDPRNDQGSAASGIAAWIAAGIPANQIVLGIASYGHGFSVNISSAFGDSDGLQSYPLFNASAKIVGDRSDDPNPGPDVCGNPQDPAGTFTYRGLMETGYLTTSGHPELGIVYKFDSCSQTPMVYNPLTEIWISYDDKRSLAAKGDYITQMGLRGFAMWEAAGDYDNQLVDSIRQHTGF